jgi:amino acid adenylation domain-containing protein
MEWTMQASQCERPFGATPDSDSPDAFVPQRVAAQAELNPCAVAVSADSGRLTRGALETQANRLAWRLRGQGVGRDVPVGLCLPRSFEMVVGALGILKAGGAYVSMDPAYPPERLAFMLEDSQAPVVVTTAALAGQLPAGRWNIVDIGAPAIQKYPAETPPVDINGADLAYVIYTSGSTGKPKGVEIAHAGLANLVSWHLDAFAVSSEDRASHLAGLGFDAAAWELWPYLAAGASLHLADDTTRGSAELLRDWLLARNITISFVPTPLTEQLLALEWPATTALRFLLTGGDTLRRYPPPGLPFVLVNNYGPTECTVVATSGVVGSDGRPGELPPIGSAIANMQVYLLDEQLIPVPAGTAAEIYIGGTGVARGYHHRPDLTAEKFVPDPFAIEPGSRLFRTGDLGRRRPDDQIDFLGRIDDQIKIRGYRIEPNEIVSALNHHPAIRESLVVVRENASGDKSLVAYVVVGTEPPPTHSSVRDFLRTHLPEYMLPVAFVTIGSLPLTPHGKIDRAALPAPDPDNTLADDAWTSPRTPTERRVAQIVAGLLGAKEVGRDDNFFLLGGHSLLGAQLIARLHHAFGMEMPLRNLFEAPTVAGLSAELDRLAGQRLTQPGFDPAAAESPEQCDAVVAGGPEEKALPRE